MSFLFFIFDILFCNDRSITVAALKLKLSASADAVNQTY